MDKPITDTDIEQLQAEAYEARDYTQAAICELALDGAYDRDALAANGAGRKSLDRLDGMTQGEARAECERVIREAAEEV